MLRALPAIIASSMRADGQNAAAAVTVEPSPSNRHRQTLSSCEARPMPLPVDRWAGYSLARRGHSDGNPPPVHLESAKCKSLAGSGEGFLVAPLQELEGEHRTVSVEP
jgi:hypothetical protein